METMAILSIIGIIVLSIILMFVIINQELFIKNYKIELDANLKYIVIIDNFQEVGKFEKELIDIAYKALLQSRADFIVANEFSEVNNKRHIAYIINNNKDIIRCVSKTSIARKLLKNISNNI